MTEKKSRLLYQQIESEDGNEGVKWDENQASNDEDKAADDLSRLLLACNDNKEIRKSVLMKSFHLNDDEDDMPQIDYRRQSSFTGSSFSPRNSSGIFMESLEELQELEDHVKMERHSKFGFKAMVSVAVTGLLAILTCLALGFGTIFESSRRQPIGPYVLIDKQEGKNFFSNYAFYSGSDSEGSNGYINYVDKEKAFAQGIANVTFEPINSGEKTEPFIYMSTTPTVKGPRNSVRLEGLKRYNRGLFIIDVRHMPAGCGTWPAFWMSDEANWPVNGEIDIIEGVNTQTKVKTALHTTRVCQMDDVPLGIKTGIWDTAQGVPMQNGTIDMTLRAATDCFVYSPHQWLNQGCVAMTSNEGTIGAPLNKKGGGVFVLEWDPVNRYIKSWAFTPHGTIPQNLRDTMKTADNSLASKRVVPDPSSWPLPYAYFPIGLGTNCPSSHFSNMRIIFNMALCGSVAGNRFFLDCPKLNEKYGSCNNYIAANTPEMDDIYWKIRGVYVYEREWERSWD